VGLFTSFQLRSRDADLRRRAAARLGVRGKRSAIASLEPLLADEAWPVREAAARALGVVADPAAVPSLVAAVKLADGVRDPAGAAAVRAAIVGALGEIGTGAAPRLIEALADRHAKLRESVIEALGAIGGAEAAEALAAALADDRSSVRQAAASALARAAGARSVPALQSALGHKDPMTRRCAAESLGSTRAPEAVDALGAALADRERAVREAAVRALAAVGTREAAAALLAALRSGDRELKALAADALRSFEWAPGDASERAAHAVVHGRYDEAAAEGAAAAEPLTAALAEREASARRGAVAALGRLRDARSAGSLAALLRDPDASVRDAAGDALAAIGPEAADALVEALGERAAAVRSAAERSIAAIGEGRVGMTLVAGVSAGQATAHGASQVRVVGTRAELDSARRAADGLDTLLANAVKKMPVDALRAVAGLADVILVETGQAPGSSERVDTEPLRRLAAAELARRGV
jgi:HEAT repeat protein